MHPPADWDVFASRWAELPWELTHARIGAWARPRSFLVGRIRHPWLRFPEARVRTASSTSRSGPACLWYITCEANLLDRSRPSPVTQRPLGFDEAGHKEPAMSASLSKVLRRVSLFLCGIGMVQVACSGFTRFTETPRAEASPTHETMVPPTAAGDRTPTGRAIPTEELQGIPDRPLSPSGPWFVFASDDSLWALNTDGSGLTSLWDIYGEGLNIDDLLLWPSPRGGRVAIIEVDQRFEESAPILKIAHLPSGEIETIANLLPRGIDYDALGTEQRTQADQVWAAVGVWNELAWSSDGSLLAFNAAIDGPSADVYVYDTTTGIITRLTDGPSQSVDLAWSPDDRYILHSGVQSLYYGYSGAGYEMQTVWAVTPSGYDEAIRVFDHPFYGRERRIAWLGNSLYLGDSWEMNCGYFDLRTIDVFSGQGPVLVAGHYDWRAFDTAGHKLLFMVSSTLADFGCSMTLDPGIYLHDLNTGQTSIIPAIDPNAVSSLMWSQDAGLFFLTSDEGLLAVDNAGNPQTYPAIPELWDPPVVNPTGDLWALVNSYYGTLAVGGRTGGLTEIGVSGVHTPLWSPDGRWLLFFSSDTLSLYAARSPAFEPIVIREGILNPQTPVLVNP